MSGRPHDSSSKRGVSGLGPPMSPASGVCALVQPPTLTWARLHEFGDPDRYTASRSWGRAWGLGLALHDACGMPRCPPEMPQGEWVAQPPALPGCRTREQGHHRAPRPWWPSDGCRTRGAPLGNQLPSLRGADLEPLMLGLVWAFEPGEGTAPPS